MRRLLRRIKDDGGTAVVEFVVLAVLVMVPLAYAALTIMALHTATYGAVTAAREAGRAYVTAQTPSAGGARAKQAANLALADQGLSNPKVKIECLGGSCLSPGSRIRVEITTEVALPLTPTDGSAASIPVTSVHETVVDRFRGSQ